MFIKRAWAEIDVSALVHNFKKIKEQMNGANVMAVVKADAYGHGVDIVVPVLKQLGASSFAVADIGEALEVRKYGGNSPVLILGYTPCEAVNLLAENNIIQTVYDYNYAKQLNQAARRQNVKLKCHIKLDTGMGRLGFDCRSNELFGLAELKELKQFECLEFEGIYTHFAVADSETRTDFQFTNNQFVRFKTVCEELEKFGFSFKYTHCCNSAGVLLHGDKYLDLGRSGIILYGLMPDEKINNKNGLIPVMEFKTVVTMVKTLRKGESVSYGNTFTANNDLKVATLAVGYADGYPRALSNKGYVLINGKKCRVLGRVCMDQTVVDVTGVDLKIGDQAILFGKELAVEEVAKLADTVNYEIICGLKSRVIRIAVNNK